MLRVVIDSNVFVSALISPISVLGLILEYWQAHAFELVICDKALDELNEVLQRPHLKAKYAIDTHQQQLLMAVIRKTALFVEGDSLKGIVRDDPKDDMFVSCAVEGQAKYIVSGDKHLKNLKRYDKIRIIEPIYFLNIIRRCILMNS